MKLQRKSVVRRLLKDVSGQTQILWVLALLALIPAIGIVLELGNGYASTGQLQALANSVAIAGAENMPNTTTATTIAGKVVTAAANNPGTRLSNIALSATNFKCLSSLTIPVGCAVSTGSSSGNYNAIQVTLTANVKSVIGGAFGMPSFATAATGTAVMNGGQNSPWNIAIILDTTGSMASNDSGLNCSGTRESCALQGVQELLKLMYPCASGSNCTAQSGNPSMVNNPVDAVSLFTFPAATTATMSKDYDCNGSSNPTPVQYTFQNVTPGSQNLTLPSGDTYQVIPFAGNYKLSDASTSLNANANIVAAAGKHSQDLGLAFGARHEVEQVQAAARLQDAADLAHHGELLVVRDVVQHERRQDAVDRGVRVRQVGGVAVVKP